MTDVPIHKLGGLRAKDNGDGSFDLYVTGILATGDIEIGAVEIKDGAADIRQTVLAASTAAVATDKPAVVALHPSSPLPALPTGTNSIGAVKNDGPNWTTVWGVGGVPFNSADQSASAASVSDAPTTGQKIVVDDIVISVGSAISVTLKEETSGTVIAGPFYMAANTTQIFRPRGKGWKLPVANKKLQVQTSGAGNVTVHAGYHSEA